MVCLGDETSIKAKGVAARVTVTSMCDGKTGSIKINGKKNVLRASIKCHSGIFASARQHHDAHLMYGSIMARHASSTSWHLSPWWHNVIIVADRRRDGGVLIGGKAVMKRLYNSCIDI